MYLSALFLGMMHFQDEHTYDIHRVEKCDIHYAMPDGEVLPFCTFNVFPEVYRDKVQKQYSIPQGEWEKTHNAWTYSKDKYIRNVKELEANPLYIKTYGHMVDYFALPVNGGMPVKNFANVAAPQKQVVVEAEKGHTSSEAEKPSVETEGDSCGCGGGSCGCGGQESEGGSGGCGCGNC